jgi:acyl-CoA thioester hydrolase
MNNSVYYHLFDSIINTYLIEECGQVPTESPNIGLVVSSFCEARNHALVVSLDLKI